MITVENLIEGHATTVTVGELEKLLSDKFVTACGNVGVVTVKDNSVNANSNDPISNENEKNLKVFVSVADEGTKAEYTVDYKFNEDVPDYIG